MVGEPPAGVGSVSGISTNSIAARTAFRSLEAEARISDVLRTRLLGTWLSCALGPLTANASTGHFAVRNSSNPRPTANASLTHWGRGPRPTHVLPFPSAYLGAPTDFALSAALTARKSSFGVASMPTTRRNNPESAVCRPTSRSTLRSELPVGVGTMSGSTGSDWSARYGRLIDVRGTTGLPGQQVVATTPQCTTGAGKTAGRATPGLPSRLIGLTQAFHQASIHVHLAAPHLDDYRAEPRLPGIPKNTVGRERQVGLTGVVLPEKDFWSESGVHGGKGPQASPREAYDVGLKGAVKAKTKGGGATQAFGLDLAGSADGRRLTWKESSKAMHCMPNQPCMQHQHLDSAAVWRRIAWRSVVATTAALLAACASAPDATATGPAAVSEAAVQVPSGALNPDVRQETIAETICTSGYTAAVRPSTTFTNGIKLKLLRERGLSAAAAAEYELDHRIPLALGGHPRSLANLVLQPWEGEGGARRKDRLERRLQSLVCAGTLGLGDAQAAIYSDWQAAYRRFVAPRGQ